MSLRNNNGSRELEVLDLIKEDPGSLTIDEILESLPKSNRKAQDFIIKLIDHIKSELLEERELDEKRKKLLNKIKVTEPMKALAQLKKEIKTKKRNNQQMLLILMGAKKMAKAMGINIDVKQLQEG